jgi:dTDP-4-dehydrorhamnose reductase
MTDGPILILGASGFLGPQLVAAALRRGLQAVAAVRRPERMPGMGLPGGALRTWDALEPQACERLLDALGPSVLVNAAALARPDECEREPLRAEALNAELPATLARLARERALRLVHVSTDLVFGARPPRNERYGEEDEPAPLHVYGRSKAAGEAAVLAGDPRALVVRLPLLYGDSLGRGLGATDQLRAALERGERPALFRDEWRTPLEVGNAARAVLELALGRAQGLLHVAGPERVSRLELGRIWLAARGLAPESVRSVTRAELGLERQRPADVALEAGRARALLAEPLLAPGAALAAGPA